MRKETMAKAYKSHVIHTLPQARTRAHVKKGKSYKQMIYKMKNEEEKYR